MKLVEPKNWPELATMLESAFDYIPLDEPPPGCEWSVVREASSDAAAELRQVEAHLLPTIEAAIRRIDIDRQLLVQSPAAAYFVSLRAQVASQFVASLTTHGPQDASSILAYPTGTRFLTIAGWLLLDWWREHGYDAACRLALYDECYE